MLHYDSELDYSIMDMNILLGQRDLKDIIVVSQSCGRHLLHYTNGVPVKEYLGNKKDLTFYSLLKYLKTFKDIKDVRSKIVEDFNL